MAYVLPTLVYSLGAIGFGIFAAAVIKALVGAARRDTF